MFTPFLYSTISIVTGVFFVRSIWRRYMHLKIKDLMESRASLIGSADFADDLVKQDHVREITLILEEYSEKKYL